MDTFLEKKDLSKSFSFSEKEKEKVEQKFDQSIEHASQSVFVKKEKAGDDPALDPANQIVGERVISEGAQVGFAEKKKEKKGVTRIDLEREAWKSVKNYGKKAVDVTDGAVNEKWDNLDLKGLLQVLRDNRDTDSVKFNVLTNSLSRLLELGEKGGFFETELDKKGNALDEEKIHSFQEAFFNAKIASQNYIISRSKVMLWFVPSKNARYQAAVRINRMLEDMQTQVRIAQQMLEVKVEEEEKEQSEEEKSILRLTNILKTGKINSKPTGDADPAWISKGYQEKLLQLIRGDEKIRNDVDFLRFMTDKKNVIMARELSVVMFAEECKDITYGIPLFEQALRDYFANAMKDSDLMYTGEFDVFKAKLSELKDNYLRDNKDLLKFFNKRVEMIKTVLDIKDNNSVIWKDTDIADLLVEESEEEFMKGLKFFADNKEKNDKLIRSLVNERVSVLNQKTIFNMVTEKLGPLRIYGSVTEIVDAVGTAVDVALFSCWDTAFVERRIAETCSRLGIPEKYRDIYAAYWSETYKSGKDDVRIGGEFLLHMQTNTRNAAKATKRKKLTKEQWKNYELLLHNCGRFEAKEFEVRLDKLLKEPPKNVNDAKISHSEYLSGVGAKKKLRVELSAENRFRTDLFLGTPEMKETFSPEELVVLQKNLSQIVLANLGPELGITGLAQLDEYSPRELRTFGRLLSKILVDKKPLIDAAGAGEADPTIRQAIRDRMLVIVAKGEAPTDDIFAEVLEEQTALIKEEQAKIAMRLSAILDGSSDAYILIKNQLIRTTNLKGEALIKAQEDNLARFGVKDEAELKNLYYTLSKDEKKREKARENSERIDRQKRYLKNTYGDKRYVGVIDHLMLIPEVVDAMLVVDEGSFANFCKVVLDAKMKPFMDAYYGAKESETFKRAYLDKYFRAVYEGNYVKDDYDKDISTFCEMQFAKQRDAKAESTWGKIKSWTYNKLGWENTVSHEDNLESAIASLEKHIYYTYDKKATPALLNIAFVYWENLMRSTDPDDMETFASADELTKAGIRAIENHEANQKAASDYVKEMIGNDTTLQDLLKGANDTETEKNTGLFMAQFAGYVAKEAITLETEDFSNHIGTFLGEFRTFYEAQKIRNEADRRTATEQKEFDRKNKEMADKIKKQRKDSAGARDKYIGLDMDAIDKVLDAKNLVRAKNKDGKTYVSNLRKGRREYEVERLKLFDSYNLSDIVKACVSEKSLSYHMSDETMIANVTQLDNIDKNINVYLDKDAKMSDDEKNLFIVYLYNHADDLSSMFQSTKPFNIGKMVKLPLFDSFRRSYAKIHELENTQIADETITAEKQQMAKNLRACLVTGAGMKDEEGKTYDWARKGKTDKNAPKERADKFDEIADRQIKYLKYKSEVNAVLNECMREVLVEEKIVDGQTVREPLSEFAYERYLYGLRTYYQTKIVKDLTDGKDFDPEVWKSEVTTMLSDKFFVRNIRGMYGKNFGQKADFKFDTVLDEGYTMEDIEHLISDKTIFPGHLKRFRKLDDDQKRLFVMALNVNNKSALGMEITGTNSVLVTPGLKDEKSKAIRDAVASYLEDKEFHVTLDFRDALSKLINTGEYLFVEGSTLSDSAFEQAMAFVEGVKLQKIYNGDRDLKRMGDGETTILEAARLYGKPQIEVLEKLKEKENTPKSVMDELYDMALREKKNDIAERIKALNEREMLMLIRILQNRTLLDESTIKQEKSAEKLHVDEDGRATMIEALIGEETSKGELADAAGSEACLKALATCYSFQMKDDITKEGSYLTKDHFVSESINRTTLVDWDIVRKAYNVMVEVRKQKLMANTVRHAADYIEISGNKKAADEYKKLKESKGKTKDLSAKDFDEYLKQQAQKDGSHAIKFAMAGYLSFTPEQKKLFVKVLGRRDLLDISKKNYYRSFLTGEERDYVNVADRFALIDDYIMRSRQENTGVALDSDAHYNALSNLFSTQFTDDGTVDFSKGAQGRFAAEKLIFMRRSTAIDWKLFKRAVSFVNRAAKELEYVEGNEELYRSAGDIGANGQLKMDYSQLRKNYHHTGNHWGRKAYRVLQNGIGDDVVDIAGDLFKDENLNWKKKEVSSHDAKSKKPKETSLKSATLIDKNLKKAYDDSLGMHAFRKNLDLIFSHKKSIDGAMNEVVKLIRIYGFFPEGVQKTGQTKALDGGKPPEGIEYEANFGDFRDYIAKGGKVGKKVLSTGWEVYDNYNTIMDTVVDVMIRFVGNSSGDEQIMKYLSENDYLKAQDRAKKLIKQPFGDLLRGIFGDGAEGLINKEMKRIFEDTKAIHTVLSPQMKRYNYAKNCANNIESIATDVTSMYYLSEAKKAGKTKADSDELVLSEAEMHQSVKQKRQNQLTVNTQKALTELGVDVSKIKLSGQITTNMYNIIVDTVSLQMLMVDKITTFVPTLITNAVNLCSYITTITYDKRAVAEYYRTSKDGIATVERLKKSLKEMYTDEEYKKKIAKYAAPGNFIDDFLEFICEGLGYEKIDELMRDTAMKVSQQVIFCASSFNPIDSTRIVSRAVMAALGLKDSIGDTSSTAVGDLFNRLNMTV